MEGEPILWYETILCAQSAEKNNTWAEEERSNRRMEKTAVWGNP
jgi:hypothetical protein